MADALFLFVIWRDRNRYPFYEFVFTIWEDFGVIDGDEYIEREWLFLLLGVLRGFMGVIFVLIIIEIAVNL